MREGGTATQSDGDERILGQLLLGGARRHGGLSVHL